MSNTLAVERAYQRESPAQRPACPPVWDGGTAGHVPRLGTATFPGCFRAASAMLALVAGDFLKLTLSSLFLTLTSGVFSVPVRAENYESRGVLTVRSDSNPSINQALLFSFRYDSGRWMLCVSSNMLFQGHEMMCLGCDGTNLVYFTKNRPSTNTSLAPYQAEVRNGSFPPYDNRFFGQIAAALEPSLLQPDANYRACMLVYPRTNVLLRCSTNYQISVAQPSERESVISIHTDGEAITPDGRAHGLHSPYDKGYEVLRVETMRRAAAPAIAEQFTIQYKYPRAGGKDVEDLEVVWELRGNITEYRELTEEFDGWPRILGRTMVADYRVGLRHDLACVNYLTTNRWLEDCSSKAFLELRDGLQSSVVVVERPWTKTRIAILVVPNAMFFALLGAAFLSHRSKQKHKPTNSHENAY